MAGESFFQRLKQGLTKSRESLLQNIGSIFQNRRWDEESLDAIEGAIDHVVRATCGDGDFSEDWDLEQLWTALKTLYPVKLRWQSLSDDENGEDLTSDKLLEAVLEDARQRYTDRETEIEGMVYGAMRERFPAARIVVGGEHATACADFILETCPDVDICVLGEGEEILLDLVRTLRRDGSLSEVAGLAYRENTTIRRTERRKRVRDIDAIPLPDWDQIPIENYMVRGLGHGIANLRSMPLMATRGCPYQCTFCSSPHMWTTRWLARTPAMVVDEMELYIERYQAKNFDFYDLTAIIKKDWIMAFAQEILRRGLKIEYQLPSGTRSEAIDEEVSEILYRSGCRQMNYAPESGSAATLTRIKKKVKLPRLEESLRGACRHGLKVMVNIILFPDDTRRDVIETFKFMLRCSWLGLHDIAFVPYVPYPGAELYDRMVKDGRLPPLGEEYFISLLTHSDISSAKSHNPRFSARQVQLMRLPGCSTGRSREPAPPRTKPRWRPCAHVISSRMALASPWRLVPSTMPSSVHCIAIPSGAPAPSRGSAPGRPPNSRAP